MGQKLIPHSVNGSDDPDLEATAFSIFNTKPMCQM